MTASMPGAARPRTPEPCQACGRGGPAGSILRATGKDGIQIVNSKGKRMTDASDDLFFDALAASCNVTWSAGECGFSPAAIYARRRRDPAFAARWDSALAQGVARLEMLLVRQAEDYLEGRAPDPDAHMPQMSVADAIAILKLHKAAAAGQPAKYPGWRGRPRPLAEVHASILAKIEAIARHRDRA